MGITVTYKIRSSAERLVCGLREYAPPNGIKVYSATTGQLLRVEPPPENDNKFKDRTRNEQG